MNCPEWEERVAGGDPEAAEHLQDCPSCAALADGLARDARLLKTLPPEAFAVDYAAIRAAARNCAVRRSRRPKILAVLAVAAAVLLTVKLPLHRQRRAPAAKVCVAASRGRSGPRGARRVIDCPEGPAPAAEPAGRSGSKICRIPPSSV